MRLFVVVSNYWYCLLKLTNVGRLLPLRPLGDFKLDVLSFVEGLIPVRLDGAVVDEHILAAAVRSDEAEALGGVEKLYGAGSHWLPPSHKLPAWTFHIRRRFRRKQLSKRDATRIDGRYMGAFAREVQLRQTQHSRSLLTSLQEMTARLLAGVLLTLADFASCTQPKEPKTAPASAPNSRRRSTSPPAMLSTKISKPKRLFRLRPPMTFSALANAKTRKRWKKRCLAKRTTPRSIRPNSNRNPFSPPQPKSKPSRNPRQNRNRSSRCRRQRIARFQPSKSSPPGIAPKPRP